MSNFWNKLPKPFFVLAPMYDVTDAAFRAMFVKYGKPDVLMTEFVSADGLASDEGRQKLLRELYFTAAERPIVAQVFGSKPENIEIAARLIKKLGFDGIDINMGCPDRAVEKQGAGAALIKNPKLAQELILATKQGAGDLPVSVKTRIGYSKIETESWAKNLLAVKPAAITFHLRTRKELSKVPAHWDEIAIPVKLAKDSGTIIIGNGDVGSVEEGKKLAEKYDLNGIMIGRVIFGRPWFFTNPIAELSLETKMKILIEHAELFDNLYGKNSSLVQPAQGRSAWGGKNFAVMRKHFKAYVSGWHGAPALRAELMTAPDVTTVRKIIEKFFASRQ